VIFYWEFTKIRNTNIQQGRIYCAIFTKFAEFVLEWIHSRGYGVMGVLSREYRVFPKSPSGETMHRINKRCRDARTCSRSSVTMPSLLRVGFHPPPGWPKTLSCFCLSVCLVNEICQISHPSVPRVAPAVQKNSKSPLSNLNTYRRFALRAMLSVRTRWWGTVMSAERTVMTQQQSRNYPILITTVPTTVLLKGMAMTEDGYDKMANISTHSCHV